MVVVKTEEGEVGRARIARSAFDRPIDMSSAGAKSLQARARPQAAEPPAPHSHSLTAVGSSSSPEAGQRIARGVSETGAQYVDGSFIRYVLLPINARMLC